VKEWIAAHVDSNSDDDTRYGTGGDDWLPEWRSYADDPIVYALEMLEEPDFFEQVTHFSLCATLAVVAATRLVHGEWPMRRELQEDDPRKLALRACYAALLSDYTSAVGGLRAAQVVRGLSTEALGYAASYAVPPEFPPLG
jgi:hypothetical protein